MAGQPVNTVYLITGANRGIGFALVAALLQRQNTTVIATVRSSTTDRSSLANLQANTTTNNKLIIANLSATSETDSKDLLPLLANHNITYIDTIIANAGNGTSYLPVLNTPLSAVRADIETNTISLIRLFQDTFPLFSKSSNPKLIFVTSSLGAIGSMEHALPCTSYGVSKAGANFVVRKIHFEHPEITTLAIHPGFVQTVMGQGYADAIGLKQPPHSVAQSVEGILKQTDHASRETTSGTFVEFEGKSIAW
ncbi:hypothetical protein B0O99DRAFT_627210 [Bisporella sp. PMI_857]|nr:hypothetical protein B0O99DRAFT_627210 [Bisporella sp. PMI_857]